MATFNVSNQSGLISALKSANGGDTINLAGGNYGRLELNGNRMPELKYSSNVTITSANKSDKASFDKVQLLFGSNITFDGIEFDYSSKSGTSKPFDLSKSSNITIKDSTFKGELSGGYGTGHGLWMAESTNVTLQNSTFEDFATASHFRSIKGLKILDNDFTDISFDAMIVGRVENVLIQGNDVDLKGRPGVLHKDAIQFWNTNENIPSKNIVIRNNDLRTDDGIAHGIFMGNEVADRTGSDNARYVNVVIENNTIVTGQALGIAVGQVDGLVVRNNFLLQNPAMKTNDAINIPVIRFQYDSEDVTITGNTTHRLPEAAGRNWQPVNDSDSSWSISGNKIVGLGGAAAKAPAASEKAPSPAAPIVVEKVPAADKAPIADKASAGDLGNNKADTFRFNDDKGGSAPNVDFSEGDRIVLIKYERDSFDHIRGGNTLVVNREGDYAVLDSLADVKELAAASSDVTARKSGDAVVMRIAQDDGDHTITLRGYASAWDNALF